MLSKKFKKTLRECGVAQYKISIQAGVNPNLLSKWMLGIQKVRDGDKRIIKIGKILKLKKDEIFGINDDFKIIDNHIKKLL